MQALVESGMCLCAWCCQSLGRGRRGRCRGPIVKGKEHPKVLHPTGLFKAHAMLELWSPQKRNSLVLEKTQYKLSFLESRNYSVLPNRPYCRSSCCFWKRELFFFFFKPTHIFSYGKVETQFVYLMTRTIITKCLRCSQRPFKHIVKWN